MESLTDLPPELEKVAVPGCFSVTRLASSGDCILKAIVPQAACPAWPPSPEAEFGRITHSLMDLAARGQIESSKLDPRPVEIALERLLLNERVGHESTMNTHDCLDLRTAFTQCEWRKRTSLAVARTLEVLNLRRPTGDGGELTQGNRIPLMRALQLEGFAASEVALESKNLRLKGRADFLRVLADGTVEVSDFKSGNVLDDEGEVDEVTALQLRLYGLGILELAPRARVELKVVSRGGTSRVTFSTEDIDKTRKWLAELTSQLPEGEWIQSERIAVVGSQCRGCKARAVCPVYRTSIAELWKRSDLLIKLPLDIAGRILEVESHAEGTTTIRLTDLAGRTTKIHRICPGILPTDFDRDGVFWFFNLASSEVAVRNGKWRHPRNFHDLPASTLERRAWTLQVYRVAAFS